MRGLFLGAHPDDVEISAGGTIVKLVSEGWEVVSLVNGFVSSDRLAEAGRAAEILGAEHAYELQISQRATINWIEGVWEPFDLIVTPSPSDSHQDHRAVAELGISLARKNNVELWHMNHAIPGGLANPPILNHFVVFDLDVQRQKERAIRAHKSQWEKYGGLAWADIIYARDRYYGGCIGDSFNGVRFAEGFEKMFSRG